MPSSTVVRFAAFEVDLQTGELRKHGLRIRVQEQPFQILVMLLEHPGTLVTREQIQQKLWPADTFVDFDHGVNTAIRRLRDALGDNADTPRFIETLPRRGYRFIGTIAGNEQLAPMREAAPDSASITASPGVPAPMARPAWSRAVLIALTCLFLAGIALLAFRWTGLWGRWFPPPIRSVLVLPLVNLSGDREQEFFADGMTEALISELRRIRPLRIISFTTSMRLKQTAKTPPQLAADLEVDGIVEGSVLRVGDRVRIRTRLIEARADRQIWSEAYDRDLRDVLRLQSEVADAITGQIRLQVAPEPKPRAVARRINPEAHEAYLQGRSFANRGLNLKSIAAFQQAIDKDPDYAPAFAGLAQQLALSLPGHETMPKARTAAQRALELDESLPEAHTALASVLFLFDWQWAEAEKEFKRALELDPGSVMAHSQYAYFLIAMGRLDEALAEARQALNLDPLSVTTNMNYARAFYFRRQYDEAIAQFDKTIALEPNLPGNYFLRGFARQEKGLYDGAIDDFRKSGELAQQRERLEILSRYPRIGYSAVFRSWAELREKGVAAGLVQPTDVAMMYARAGEKEKAFQFLEQGFREHTRTIVNLNVEPQMDSLRSDPRFAALVRKVGLPPVPAQSKH